MTDRPPAATFGPRARRIVACIAGLAAACAAAPSPPTRWIKTGADEATVTRELKACREHANAVLAREQGINADITATLGGNWQRSSTLGIQSQSLNSSAEGLAVRSLENCMLAKGFTKAS